MLQNLKKKQEGFTIIEVMIVLVIAAVILLIVFLAVPALQRNSRNTQIKNDVAAVLAAATEFQSNNNGAMPTSITNVSGTSVSQTVTVSGASGTTNTTTAKVNGGTEVTTGTTPPTNGSFGKIVVGLNKGCNESVFTSDAKNRTFAATFRIENGTANGAPQCQES